MLRAEEEILLKMRAVSAQTPPDEVENGTEGPLNEDLGMGAENGAAHGLPKQDCQTAADADTEEKK